MGFGNTSRRFTQTGRRLKGNLAKDRFAFDQAIQGHDCIKIRKGGDFMVREPTVFEVKVDNSKLTEAQLSRRRKLGRNRYRIVRY
jgi:hypothetical protein